MIEYSLLERCDYRAISSHTPPYAAIARHRPPQAVKPSAQKHSQNTPKSIKIDEYIKKVMFWTIFAQIIGSPMIEQRLLEGYD